MKIALIGYGKMGKAIEAVNQSRTDNKHDIFLKINSENRSLLFSEEFKKTDVAIEFSTPETAFENIKACLNQGVPVVCGTTGWNDRLSEVKELSRTTNTAFLHASNFSIGVNLFFALNRKLANLMAGYQETYAALLEETHHLEKKDHPSGTAISIAEQIFEKNVNYNRWQVFEENAPSALPEPPTMAIVSYRKEGVSGLHTVHYTSNVDRISITHEAFNRTGFALGALLAAEWIADKKGPQSINDFLSI